MATRIQFNAEQISAKVTGAWDRSLFALTSQIAGDANEYTKVDQHTLENSIKVKADNGVGQISWNTPYAKRQYWEIKTSFTPGRTWKWFETAKRKFKADWQKLAEKLLRENL